MNATNQQLAFARIQVQAAESAASTLVRRAHWQACVLQLSLALESYASELCNAVKLDTAVRFGPRLFSHLAEDAHSMGRDSAELNELAQLEQEGSSWLAALGRWHQAVLSIGVESHKSSVLAETSLTEQERSDTIKLVEVAEAAGAPGFGGDRLQNLLAEAAGLIERQRQNSAEY
jgi:hypothetical protein